ncbi:MAG TPA: thioesterase family protein [Anaerolineae bacterium]|nr:thioesterase family protein [Anaerolineae bacterium]
MSDDQVLSKEQILQMVVQLFNEGVPFNRHLGLEVAYLDEEQVIVKVNKKPELVGNIFFDILHGGVAATVLDTAGGLVAIASAVSRLGDTSAEMLQKRLQRTGTVDMRIDYLRPGRGNEFTATARVVRHGRQVAVTRMEMHNESGEEIALGTATYMVG